MARIRDLPKIVSLIRHENSPLFVVLQFENYKKFIQKLDLEGNIDEDNYIHKYPDVKRAISEKKAKSALHHYLNSGYVEQRNAVILDDTEIKERSKV